jgi:hypothetical protein
LENLDTHHLSERKLGHPQFIMFPNPYLRKNIKIMGVQDLQDLQDLPCLRKNSKIMGVQDLWA